MSKRGFGSRVSINEDFLSLKVERCILTRVFLCWAFGAAVLFHLFMSQMGSALRGGVEGARPACVHGLTSDSQDTQGSWPFSGCECMQALHMHRHSNAARTTAEMSVGTTMEQG